MNNLEVIHNTLTAKGWGLATAESVTAGMVASNLASNSGSSAYLRGGVVAYTLESKVALLGVNRETAAPCNCVSPSVAMAMASGAQKAFKAECVIATTGYAEPQDGQRPYAYVTVICGKRERTQRVVPPEFGRNETRQYLAERALWLLASMLQEVNNG